MPESPKDRSKRLRKEMAQERYEQHPERHREAILRGVDVTLTEAELAETHDESRSSLGGEFNLAWAALNKLFGRSYVHPILMIDGPASFTDFRLDCDFRLIQVIDDPRLHVFETNCWDGLNYPLYDDTPYVIFSLSENSTVTLHGWYCLRNKKYEEISRHLTDATIGPESLNTIESLINETRKAIAEDREPKFFKAWKIATEVRRNRYDYRYIY